MFTGIVEEIGKIISFTPKGNYTVVKVSASKVLEGVNLGDSICVSGVCLTVCSFDSNSFLADIQAETFRASNFSKLAVGAVVNLERALTPSTRLGGHFVTGHIDSCGVVKTLSQKGVDYLLEIELEKEALKFVVSKGSIAINGISLTVGEVNDKCFSCYIIPHTLEKTDLNSLKIGSLVNIETDILGKYIYKFANFNDKSSKIDAAFLSKNGFF